MNFLVLDNSVTMRWCFQDTNLAYADGILQQVTEGEAFVPVVWRYEVSSVIVKAQRDGILAPAKADAFFTQLDFLAITTDAESVEHIFTDVHRLALTHGLTSYDAAYLELAIRGKIAQGSKERSPNVGSLTDEAGRDCRRG